MAVKKLSKETETNVEVSVEKNTDVKKAVETNVEVDTTVVEVDNSKQKDGGVRIKMKKDHKCCIAMKRYDLEAGKTYTVPKNVKEILSRADLLMPL